MINQVQRYEGDISDKETTMNDDKDIKIDCIAEKIISIILEVICYSATIYMMVIMFIKYIDNIDSSQISMKEFNMSPVGRYPSFTFCIYGKDGVMFDGKKLEKRFGVEKRDFYDFLSGEKDMGNLSNKNEIEIDEIIMGIDSIVKEFAAEDQSYQKYNKWNQSIGKDELSLISRYHDPTTNCFEYSTPYDPNINLNAIKIKFNITRFLNVFTNEARLYVQAQYPGQLIRDVKTYLFKVADWDVLGPEHKNNQILVQFPGITLLRFRQNAKEACDPNLLNDDEAWKNNVIANIGCIPIYWNKTNKAYCNSNKINYCNSSEDYKKFKSYWPMFGGRNANKPFRNYLKPCNKMLLFNNINRLAYNDHNDTLKIKFRIRGSLYQEVLNSRGFGFDDLWASIGGYVGIFCGYSFLQGATYIGKTLKAFIKRGQ